MLDLLRLLQELKVSAIEQKIIIVPFEKDSLKSQGHSYQLQLELETNK